MLVFAINITVNLLSCVFVTNHVPLEVVATLKLQTL